MKKISLLATLSVAAMFAACGDNGSSADNDDVTYSSSAENIDTVSSSSADNAGVSSGRFPDS